MSVQSKHCPFCGVECGVYCRVRQEQGIDIVPDKEEHGECTPGQGEVGVLSNALYNGKLSFSEFKMRLDHQKDLVKRPCLNELQKEYCVKIKLIVLH